jgi:signal transduction histidine kinase
MQETGRIPRETLYQRDRGEALKGFLRRFRHEISTPLSGANLHLEVALRRMQRPGGFDPAAVVENLRTCQQSLESAARMLELIAEASHEEVDEPAEFSLAASISEASEPFRDEAMARGLLLEIPAPSPEPRWFASPRDVALAIEELTRNAVNHSSVPGSIRWSIEDRSSEVVLTCRSSGRIPAGDPEHLFGVTKREASPGRGFGLLRARRAAQSSGAELELRQEGEEVFAVLRFRKKES